MSEGLLVLHHGPCWDGLAAAFVVRLVYPEAELVACTPREPPPLDKCRGRDVVVLDVCWAPPELGRLLAVCCSLRVLDHHQSAIDMGAHLVRGVTIDVNRCGIELAWDHFCPPHAMPQWLHYLGLRDRWLHRADPDADAFCAGLPAEPSLPLLQMLWDYPDMVYDFAARGRQQIAERDARWASLAAGVVEMRWQRPDGTMQPLLVVPAEPADVSDLGHWLCDRRPDCIAVLWRGATVSLRSHERGPSVLPLAAAYGGGGHVHAAGFQHQADSPSVLFINGGTPP
jgi:hypothetical protein